MSILKQLPELIEAGILNEETAEKIRDFYRKRSTPSSNRLLIVFGVLGSILVGLGIILIIAHNWDDLPRNVKTIFAFLPLVMGQVICGYVLLKKRENTTWKESSTTFLFFAIGACISLISQIYHIPGNLSGFLLTWSLLALPLIYVMNSSISSLLYIIGITYYAGETSYWHYPNTESYWYWLLLIAVLPHYYQLIQKKKAGNFLAFHHWFIPLSVIITLGTLAKNQEDLMFIAYISLFGFLYQIGNYEFFSNQKLRNNGYKILGSLGTIVLLLSLSFDWFWNEHLGNENMFSDIIYSPEFIAVAVTSSLATILLYKHQIKHKFSDIKPIDTIFILFIFTYILGAYFPIGMALTNFFVFGIGILTIREGSRKDHLGILNYGLLVITALVVCRFFDSHLTFVVRGMLFLIVGVGFFLANYYTIKRRKTHE